MNKKSNSVLVDAHDIPDTLEEALNPEWLSAALAPVSEGSRVVSVDLTEVVKAMASKVRIAVRFENDPDRQHFYCVKGFLDTDQDKQATGFVTLREADFYTRIAPHITMRVPGCASVVADRDAPKAVMILEDVIASGGTFCDTHHPFSLETVRQTLDQIARLHAASHLLQDNTWIDSGIEWMAESRNFPLSDIQQKMHDGRGEGLPDTTLDAATLLKSVASLAERSRNGPQTLLHGDSHIANVYMTDQGPGFADWQLIKRGSWAVDVAYHIACVLPVEVAEAEERALVEYYLEALQSHGGIPPDAATAWEDYCCALPYGFYLWAITARVDPTKTYTNFQRIGAAVTRNEAYRHLGVI